MCTRTERVRQGPAGERFELVVSHLDQLPPLPSAAARLVTLLVSGDSSAGAIAEIIESDAWTTAGVLHLVRRFDSGKGGAAETVVQAVAGLDARLLGNAALAMQLSRVLFSRDGPQPHNVIHKEIWQHSLAVACAAELITEHAVAGGVVGGAFACGLLHDVGRLALAHGLPRSYARVVQRVQRHQEDLCDAERAILGLDHTSAGKRLVVRWGLPQAIVDCVWLHHQSPEAVAFCAPCPERVHVVHLADGLVGDERRGASPCCSDEDVEELTGRLGLTTPELQHILTALPMRMAPICAAVGLDAAKNLRKNLRRAAPARRAVNGVQNTPYPARARETGGDAGATAVGRDPVRVRARTGRSVPDIDRFAGRVWEPDRSQSVRATPYDAMERFTKALGPHDRIGDVCRAAAQSIHLMVNAEAVVAFSHEPAGGLLHVGCSASTDDARPVSVLHLGRSRAVVERKRVPRTRSAAGLVEAPADLEEVWRRCAGRPPGRSLWMLPLGGPDGRIGGVLVAAGEDALHVFEAQPRACGALAAAFALALTSAHARETAERLNQELLDLHRRLRGARNRLVRNRSLTMIAAMAAGAAHEINNPLSVISARAQMVLEACPDEASARAMRIIKDQTRRASQIVMDLMQFAKPPPPSPVSQPLEPILEQLCQRWRACSPVGQPELTFGMADHHVTVCADRTQLDEILDAVTANAVEATNARSGLVQINSPSRSSDETVRIVIADNGIGMTRDVLEHAVDPFFSSRDAGRSRGLGLSRAHRLAEINGGCLRLESKPSYGTTVTIELPAGAPQPTA